MSFAYLPLFTGDYIRDTQHLSCSEHGIYLKLLMHCWDQKGPAPLDERKLCGIVNARSSDEIEAMRRVLGEFFTRMEDGHYNKRMQVEIERSDAISSARSTAGKKGAQAKAKHLPSKRQTIAKQVPLSPSPSPSLEPNTTPSSPPEGDGTVGMSAFDQFWSAYPKKVGKDAAAKAFGKRKPSAPMLAKMLSAIEEQKRCEQWRKDGGQYIPNPATWLNQGRWDDVISDGLASGGNDIFAGAL